MARKKFITSGPGTKPRKTAYVILARHLRHSTNVVRGVKRKLISN